MSFKNSIEFLQPATISWSWGSHYRQRQLEPLTERSAHTPGTSNMNVGPLPQCPSKNWQTLQRKTWHCQWTAAPQRNWLILTLVFSCKWPRLNVGLFVLFSHLWGKRHIIALKACNKKTEGCICVGQDFIPDFQSSRSCRTVSNIQESRGDWLVADHF